ncbi:MAG: low-specificity L-threonine aldolase [Chthonomonadales bacterium]
MTKNSVIDLRSDTVTKPTPEMRTAMANAEVGDDVFGDDPTVLRLEALAAEILGKEASLFVPTGTMGNSIAINVHTNPGDEILLDSESHSMCYEVAGPAIISSVQTRNYTSVRGIPDPEQIASQIKARSLHTPQTSLIVVENTHNRHGGAVIPLSVCREVREVTKARGVKLHLDGARLFNAAVAAGIPAADYAAQADSISFCLSKGLGCPVGSMLCGTREFVEDARRVRKMLGGGMRQVGILAAAGIYALENNIKRLAEDHANAQYLANLMADIPNIEFDKSKIYTNMIYFKIMMDESEFLSRLANEGVLTYPDGPRIIRFVTHLDVNRRDMEVAANALRRVTTN